MSLLPETTLPDSFPPYQTLRDNFGFVPAIFRAQSLLPRVIEAEAQIAGTVLLAPGALTRVQKETILLTLAARHRNVYCVTAHRHFLDELGVSTQQLDRLTSDHRDAALAEREVALLDFALKLGTKPTAIHGGDIEVLRRTGWADEQLLEAIVMTALTNFLCTLSAGLGVAPDFEPQPVRPSIKGPSYLTPPVSTAPTKGPYLRAVSRDPKEFPPFAFFQEKFGFIPNLFRAQTLRPDIVAAEAFTVGTIMVTDDVLSRVRKEYILLAISAANLSTYCVAAHCEMLRNLGIAPDASDQIAVDHRRAQLDQADKALLDVALKIAHRSSVGFDDVDLLRTHGFDDPQILEAVVVASMTNFVNTLSMGLGTVPDVHPRRVFATSMNLFAGSSHPTLHEGVSDQAAGDPDAEFVARAKSGDTDAFEALVRAHHRRVYRMLLRVTGNAADAEDSTQTAFLNAFHHIRDFEGHARFGTWLTRIAINEGLECVRRRKPTESLSLEEDGGPEFRPRLVLAWVEDPERLYEREELRALIQTAVSSLPEPYRLAVVLRDLEQFSTAEAAAALGLRIPTLKTRLLRGRLMLREALAPSFIPRTGAPSV